MTLVEMLKEKTGRDFEEVTTTKTNGLKLEGVRVINPTVNILPILYRPKNLTDEQFADYVAENYSKYEQEDSFDLGSIFTKEFVLNNVFPALINTAMNEEMLSETVHKNFNDLSIIYKIDIPESSGMITIKPHMLDYIHATEDEIHEAAMKNINPKLTDMADIMGTPSGMMYVLSNVQYLYGAGAILANDILDSLYEDIGEFYIIPSSLHEVICLPKLIDDTKLLKEMVMSINRTELRLEERLSDNVYIYNGNSVELVGVA